MDTRPLIKAAVDIVGSQTELANRCKVKQQHVWRWLNTCQRLPAERCIAIEKATDGKITRHDLRPDIFGQPTDAAA